MPWREFEINNFGGMVTNVPMKDKSESLLVENLTLAEKPGVLTLRKGYSELYEAPPIFSGEQNSIVAYTTFVTDKPSREEIFVIARRWSRNGKKGLNFWIRKAFNKWTNEFEDKWQLVNPVFFGILFSTVSAEEKSDTFYLETSDDVGDIGLEVRDLIGWTIELPEYGIKTEVLSAWSVYGGYKIRTAECFSILNDDEIQDPDLFGRTQFVMYASYLPSATMKALYETPGSDIVFHNVLSGLRVGFGGRENAIGLSLGFVDYCIDAGGVLGDCERNITEYELDRFIKNSKRGFSVDEYNIITNDIYGFDTDIENSDEPLDLGYYKIRMTALLDDFNEVLVAEKTVSVEEYGKGIKIIPYIKLGGENKRITAFRLYASIDGITFQRFGEELKYGVFGQSKCEGFWVVDKDGRLFVSKQFTSTLNNIDLQPYDNVVAPGDRETSSVQGITLSGGGVINGSDSAGADETDYGDYVVKATAQATSERVYNLGLRINASEPDEQNLNESTFSFYASAVRENSGNASNDITVSVKAEGDWGVMDMDLVGQSNLLPVDPDIQSASYHGYSFNLSGLATAPTRFYIIFGNVPAGVKVYVDDVYGEYSDGEQSGYTIVDTCQSCQQEQSDFPKLQFYPALSTPNVEIERQEVSDFVHSGNMAVSFIATGFGSNTPFSFYLHFELEHSSFNYEYLINFKGNVIPQSSTRAVIFLAKASSPTVDIGVFRKEVNLPEIGNKNFINISESVEISGDEDFVLTLFLLASDGDVVRVGLVSVQRPKYISGFDKSTVFGEDMEDVLGYIPTFDYVRDWAFAVSLNGRIHYLAPYIDKKYHNLIVQSHISGAGAFMYDIATPENFLNIEKYAGGEPVGMAIMPTSDLLILRTNGFTIVDPDNNYIRENNVTAGCVAKKSVVQSGGSIFWCGDDDIYALSPSSGLVPRGITGKTIRDIYLRSLNKEFILAEVDEYGVVVFLLEDERGMFEARIEPNGWVVSRYNAVQKFIKFLTLRGVMSFVNSEGSIYLKEENASNCIE